MDIKLRDRPFIIFDLDDTLYNEIEYLKSGFKEISLYYKNIDPNIIIKMLSIYNDGGDVFEYLHERYPNILTKDQMISIYRNHYPIISLFISAQLFLKKCMQKKIPMGMITDGRSITQRNKLKALGIEDFFELIIISEEFGSDKLSVDNFCVFEDMFKGYQFYYIGDNVSKDFINGNKRRWKTIGIKDNGNNIHSQSLSDVKEGFLPNLGFVKNLNDINIL